MCGTALFQEQQWEEDIKKHMDWACAGSGQPVRKKQVAVERSDPEEERKKAAIVAELKEELATTRAKAAEAKERMIEAQQERNQAVKDLHEIGRDALWQNKYKAAAQELGELHANKAVWSSYKDDEAHRRSDNEFLDEQQQVAFGVRAKKLQAQLEVMRPCVCASPVSALTCTLLLPQAAHKRNNQLMVDSEEKIMAKEMQINELKAENEALRGAQKAKLAQRAAEAEAKCAQLKLTIKNLEEDLCKRVALPLHQRVTQAYESLKREHADLLMQVEELRGAVADMELRLSTADKEYRETLSALQGELDTARNTIQQHDKTAADSLAQQQRESLDVTHIMEQAAATAIAGKEATIKTHLSQIEVLQAEMETLRTENEKKLQEQEEDFNTQLKQQQAGFDVESEISLQQCVDLEEEAEKSEASFVEMENAKNEAVAKFTKEAAESQASIHQLQEDAKERDRKQTALLSEVETLEARIKSMEVDNEERLQARNDEMKARLSKSQLEHGEHVAKIMAEISTLKNTTDARYEAVHEKNTAAEEALAQEKATTATIKEEAKAAAEQFDAAQKDSKEKAAEIAQVRQELVEAKESSKAQLRETENEWKTKFKQQQAEFDIETENAVGQCVDLEEQLEEVQTKLQEQEVAASDALVKKQEECSESIHKQEETFTAEKGAYQNDIKLKSSEIDALKAEVEKLRINTPEILHKAEDEWKAKLSQLTEEHRAAMEPLNTNMMETTNRLKRLEESNTQLNAKVAGQKLSAAGLSTKQKAALEKQEGDFQTRAAKLEKQRIAEVAAVQTELDRLKSDFTQKESKDEETHRKEIFTLEAEREAKIEALKSQIDSLETRLNDMLMKVSAQKLASGAAVSKEKKVAAAAVEQEAESAKSRIDLLEKQKNEQIENLETEQTKLKVEQSTKLSEMGTAHDEKIKRLKLGFNAEKVALAAQIVALKADIENGHNQLTVQNAAAAEEKKKLSEQAKTKLKEREEKQIQKILKLETLKVEEVNVLKDKLVTLQENADAAALDKDQEWKERLSKLLKEQAEVEQQLKAEMAQVKVYYDKELSDVKRAHLLELQQQASKAQAEMEDLRKAKESELNQLDEMVVALKTEKALELAASKETTAGEVKRLTEAQEVEMKQLQTIQEEEVSKLGKQQEELKERLNELDKLKSEELSERDENIAKQNAEAESLSVEIAALKEAVANLRNSVSEKDDENAQLVQSSGDKDIEIAKLKDECEALRKELARLKEEIASLKNVHAVEVSNLTTEVTQAQAAEARAREDHNKCEEKLQKSKTSHKDKMARVNERHTKAMLNMSDKAEAQIKDEGEKWKLKVDNLEFKVSEAEAAVETETDKLKQLKEETDEAAAAAAEALTKVDPAAPVGARVMRDAKLLWDQLDNDGSGSLQSEELLQLYQWLVAQLTAPDTSKETIDAEAHKLLKATSGKRMGRGMTWDQFQTLYNSMMQKQMEKEIAIGAKKIDSAEAKKIFDKMDKDKSEEIGGDELRALMQWYVKQLGAPGDVPLNPEEETLECDKFLGLIDADKDGNVSWAEFEKFYLDRSRQVSEVEKRLIRHRIETANNIIMQTTPELDNLDKALSEAQKYWNELDVDGSGELSGNELNKLVGFVVGMVAGPTANIDDVIADTAMAKSLVEDKLCFEQFEVLLTTLYKRQADFELMLGEAESDFNLDEAKDMFHKLDTDNTGYIEGGELEQLSQWIFGEFAPGGVLLTGDQVACEAKKMIHIIDQDGDRQVSLEEFKSYFTKRRAQLDELRRASQLAKVIQDERHEEGEEGLTMTYVRKKFNQLDKDGSGSLDENEAQLLAEWVFTSFTPNGKTLDESQVKTETAKLMSKLDRDHSGNIEFFEFEDYFNTKYSAAKRYAKQMNSSGEKQYKNMLDDDAIPVAPVIGSKISSARSKEEGDTEAPELSFAYRKFKELDVDDSGRLDRDEMFKLCRWVYTSFRTDGALLDDMQARVKAQELLDKLDKDGDKAITFEELMEFFESKRKQSEIFHGKLKEKGVVGEAKNCFAEGEVVVVASALPTMCEAMSKFKELDDDNSGELDVSELKELAHWIYTTFSDNDDLDAEQLEVEAGKVLKKLDKDGSGGVSYEEFVKYYEKKLKQAARFEAAVKKKMIEDA